MKRYFWILAAALVSLAACNKNELQNGAEETPGTPAVTVIRAEINNGDSKGSVNDAAKFTWNTGDRIAVWANGYKISDPLDASFDGKSSADFTFSGANAVTESARANFAIYPASLVWDGTNIISGSASNYTASSLKLTMPQMYSLSEVQGDLSPTPMIAANAENGSLSFKALCPLIRFTVRNIPKQTRRIDFTFNNYDVYGEFELTSVNPGSSGITKATDGQAEFCLQTKGGGMANETIIVFKPESEWLNELVINISVPVVGDPGYDKVVITARDEDNNAILSQTVWPKGTSGWKPARTTSKKLTVNMPVFTFASGKKGIFAPGNLQYISGAWHFAAGQYVRLGAGSQSDDSRDLFGWGTGTAPNETSTSDETYSTFTNWGVNVIDGYAANTWRTPTDSDWSSVFTRSVANIFVPAVIETPNRYGILIFPDDYTAPAGLSIDFSNINYYSSSESIPYTSNMISDADWLLLESVGCVFLPYAGEREGTSAANYSDGVYWSLTSSTETTASTVFFQANSFGWNNPVAKHRGVAVRLVRDLN